MDILTELHKRKNEWKGVLRSFNCPEDDIEDVIHDMYLKIHKLTQKGTNILYNETEVNSWYIYLTLKSIYLNKVIRSSKFIHSDCYINNSTDTEEMQYDIEMISEKVIGRLNKMSWYNREVYKMVTQKSIKKVALATGIKYHSLRNTKMKVEAKLREEIKKWL